MPHRGSQNYYGMGLMRHCDRTPISRGCICDKSRTKLIVNRNFHAHEP
ncbi:hypothetical protein FDUTEX481_02092 [Tolypothrix sp. PCC 7601]|nr:hypothetical protein FDUTEX481_02092 [Tolypothrix sp. PCC 7601]